MKDRFFLYITTTVFRSARKSNALLAVIFLWMHLSLIPVFAQEAIQPERTLQAGELLTLEDAFERALHFNHSIVMERLRAEQARNNVSRGNAGQLPTIDVTAGAEYSRNNTDLELANFSNAGAGNTVISVEGAESRLYQAGINLNYTLFDGFSGRYRYRQFQQLDRIAQLGIRFTVEQTLYDVAQRYFSIIEAQEMLEIEQDNLKTSELRVQLTRDAQQFGRGRQIDVLNAEVNAGQDSIRVEQAENRLLETWRSLFFLMGMDASKNLNEHLPEISHTYDEPAAPEIDVLLQLALHQNVSIALAESELTLAELTQRLQATGRFPRFSIQGRYGWLQQENDANQLRSLEQTGLTASVNVRYNLFDGFNTRRSVQNAAIERKSRDENKRMIMRKVETDVLNAWSGFQTQLRALTIAQQTVRVAELQFEQAQEASKIGQISGIELRDAQLTLLSTQLSLTQIKNDLRLREMELLLLSGNFGQ